MSKSRRLVLVVEGDMGTRYLICDRLNRHEYVTVGASDPVRALSLFRKYERREGGAQEFDLVVIDAEMRNDVGLALTRYIAEETPRLVPVVLLSNVRPSGISDASYAHVAAVLMKGGDEFLHQLVDTVDRVLER